MRERSTIDRPWFSALVFRLGPSTKHATAGEHERRRMVAIDNGEF
jgi:hypothetical protein